MNEDTLFKKIERLINPIRGDLKVLKRDLKKVRETQESHTETLETHTEILQGHTETLETHTGSLVNIETTIKAYGDMYKINDDNIRKIEKRTVALEEKAGIEAPEELTLTKIQ